MPILLPQSTPPMDQTVRLNCASLQATGLGFAMLDGLVLTDLAQGAVITPTGTIVGTTIVGRVRGFGSTMGAGTTDKLALPDSVLTAPQSGNRTWSAWLNMHGAGGNSAGRVCEAGGVTTWRANSGTATIVFLADYSTTDLTFTYATPSLDVWHHHVIVETAGVPSAYIDGVSVTLGAITNGTGSMNSNTSASIGNRTDGTRNWDGMIGDFRIYKRALSPAEVWQLWAPQTRWDLYAPTRQRFVTVGASVTGVARLVNGGLVNQSPIRGGLVAA